MMGSIDMGNDYTAKLRRIMGASSDVQLLAEALIDTRERLQNFVRAERVREALLDGQASRITDTQVEAANAAYLSNMRNTGLHMRAMRAALEAAAAFAPKGELR